MDLSQPASDKVHISHFLTFICFPTLSAGLFLAAAANGPLQLRRRAVMLNATYDATFDPKGALSLEGQLYHLHFCSSHNWSV